MTIDNENATQASSVSFTSTISTATTGSSRTPPPARTVVVNQETPRMTPPRTVHVLPEPVPYAQLCFNAEHGTLMSMLVGKVRPPKYAQLEESPDLRVASSSQSSSVDSSTGWSTDSSNSSSDDESTDDCYSTSPQEIVWMDRAWLFSEDDSSNFSEIHLLHDCGTSDESDSAGSTRCGKKLLRSVVLCKLKSKQVGNATGWSPDRLPQRTERKRFSLGNKHRYRYMTLTE